MSLITWTDGSLEGIVPNNSKTESTTLGRQGGKYYYELTTTGANGMFGISDGVAQGYSASNCLFIWYSNGNLYGDGLNNSNYPAPRFAEMDTVVGIAIDMDNGKLQFIINGIPYGYISREFFKTKTLYPSFTSGSSSGTARVKGNFGATPFKYPVPEGYLPYDIDNADWWTKEELITWNPNDKSEVTILSNNNLTVDTSTTLGRIVRATKGKTTGKWYYEIVLGGNVGEIGFAELDIPLNIDVRADLRKRGYRPSNGNKTSTNVGGTSWKEGCVAGDVVGVAIDFNSGIMNIYKNGVNLGTIFDDIKTLQFPLYPYTLGSSSSNSTKLTHTTNFGATPFQYELPEGYLPYDTDNADWFIKNKYLVQDGDKIKKPAMEGLEEIGDAPVAVEMFEEHGTHYLSDIIGEYDREVDMIHKGDLEAMKLFEYKLVGYSDISKLNVN